MENRWWVDQQRSDVHPLERPKAKFGRRFFQTAEHYDQTRAQLRLTDLNRQWFDEAPGPPGEWAVLHLLPRERFAAARLDKVRAALAVPPGGRGVLVDSGNALRAIVTGEPLGDRLVEVRFGQHCTLDAWIRGEWVREVRFRNFHDALRRAPRLVRTYLTTARGNPL